MRDQRESCSAGAAAMPWRRAHVPVWVAGPGSASTPCETSTSTHPVGEVQEAHAAAVGLGEEARGWARVGGSRWRHRSVRDQPWQQC